MCVFNQTLEGLGQLTYAYPFTWCKHCGVSKFADFCGKNQLLKILRMALHNESQFLFWSFYEDRQHFSKNRTKTSQSETNKTTILKVKGKGWSYDLCVFNQTLWILGELTYT